MITGFNTDVEHDGIVYHVQTEDKGLETPLMLSLVYTGGAILASKRVRYDDLIAAGFDERVLAERLQRQHQLICAAIRTGRIEELKKMSERDTAARASAKKESQPVPTSFPIVEPVLSFDPAPAAPAEPTKPKHTLPPRREPRLPAPTLRTTSPSVRVVIQEPALETEPVVTPAPLVDQAPAADFAQAESVISDSLNIVLVDERTYCGGDRATFRIRLESGGSQRQSVPNADVMVKVLGSTFRPMIFQTRTGQDGVAVVNAELPHFTSGRAAILIRATIGDLEAELRRIIQQG